MAVLVQPEGDYERLLEDYIKEISSRSKKATKEKDGEKQSKTSSEQKEEKQQTSK